MDDKTVKIMKLREAAANNDMETVIYIMNDSSYCYEIGREAVGIAFARMHYDIAYQLLSFPGSLDKFFDHPFMVDNGLKSSVKNYIMKRELNIQ